MLCVDCGKEKEIFRDGSCLECYLKNHRFTYGPSVIDIPLCVHCGALKYKSTWTNDDLETIVKRWIKHLYIINRELRDVRIEVECNPREEDVACRVSIIGFIEDVEVEEKHSIIVRLKNNVCNICSRKFGGYHEAILQLRASQRKLSEDERRELRSFIEQMVTSIQEKGNRALFITDIGEEHGGLDFYLSDRQAAHTIIKKTQEHFGGELKISSKTIGVKDGRKLYRMTYLLRLYPFRQGDFIIYNDTLYKVLYFSKNKIHLLELLNWSEINITTKELPYITLLGGDEITQEMIIVSQVEDEVQLMDPKTYVIQTIKKPQPINLKGETIKVITFKNEIYLLPPIKKRGDKNFYRCGKEGGYPPP